MNPAHRWFLLATVAALVGAGQGFATGQPPPDIQWQRSLGGSEWDVANCVRQTRDSGYIIAGFARSFDGDVTGHQGAAGTDDFWIVKLDASGTTQWERTYGGTQNEQAKYVEQTSDGGYIVAGWTASFDGDVTGHHGNSYQAADYWVIKLDASGTLQWEKCCGGDNDDFAYCIHQTSDGGYIVAGSSGSTNGDVTGMHGSSDYWVVKLDATGTIQWQKCLGGSDFDIANSLQPTSDGGYIVAGKTTSVNGDVTQRATTTGGNSDDYWVVKLNSVGAIQWDKCYGGSAQDIAHDVQQLSDGGYVIVGSSLSLDGYLTANLGATDCWIVRTDATGNIKWSKSYGGASDDVGESIQCLKDGSFVVAGALSSSDAGAGSLHGGGDAWILQLDSLGAVTWQRALGGSSEDVATSAVPTVDGGFIVVALSKSNNGDVTGHHGDNSTTDMWIVKLGFHPVISSATQLTMPALICATTALDTIFIHNTGSSALVIDSAAFDAAGTSCRIISPTVFPDSVAVEDSIRVVLNYSPPVNEVLATTLNIYSNDSTSGHRPWIINVSGRKDSIGFVVHGAPADTLDFGILACKGKKDSTFDIENVSSIQTTFALVSGNAATFKLAQSSVTEAASGRATVTIHFNGTTAAGGYFTILTITDTCGRSKQITLRATVDSAIILVAAPPDTTVCPGDSCVRFVSVLNASACRRTLRIVHGPPGLFTIRPDSLLLAPGDAGVVKINYAGAKALGLYSTSWRVIDDCGNTHLVTTNVRVDTASIVAAYNPEVVTCAGDSMTIQTRLFNNSAADMTMKIFGDNPLFTYAPDIISIAAGSSTPVSVTFTGSIVAGTYVVHYTLPGCGSGHVLSAQVRVDTGNVAGFPPSDTIVCPNVPTTRSLTFHNTTTARQTIQLSGNNSLFAFAPDTLSLLPGDSGEFILTFLGSTVEGAHTAEYSYRDLCEIQHTVSATVIVDSATIALSQITDTTVCAGDSAVRVLRVRNRSRTSQSIAFLGNASLFSIRPDTIALDSGDSALVAIVFHGAAAGGMYTATYQIINGCGTVQNVSATLHIDSTEIVVEAISDTSICIGTSVNRVVRFHNMSSVLQRLKLSGNNSLFNIVPDSIAIAAGDSAQGMIVFRGSPVAGTFTVEYSLPGCNGAQRLRATVRVDSTPFVVSTIRDTTVCPGDSAIRYATFTNVSSARQTFHLTGGTNLFTCIPDSFSLAAGESTTVEVIFSGSSVIGSRSATYSFSDACGMSHAFSITVNVDTASVTASSLTDVTTCPNNPLLHSVNIYNTSSTAQTIQLNSGDTLFTFNPPSITLAAGDSAPLLLMFHGAPDTGTYVLHVPLPGCGAGNAITATIHVVAPNIHIPQSLGLIACPFTPIVVTIPITNQDAIDHPLTISSSIGNLSRQSIILGAAQTDSITLMLPGGPAGTITAVVTVTDECGIAHNIAVTVNFRSAPPLQLSLQTDAGATRVGVERRVYLIATPSSSVAAGNFTFTVTNEPTALEFDRIATLCATSIIRGANLQTITFNVCSTPASDTIATLYYRTLVGSTLSPSVTLQNATTTNTCDTVSGSGAATIMLLAPGCELGTVVVHPFATTIQSIYPNPATGLTSITYSTAGEAPLSLIVYDALGRSVQTLVDGLHKPGCYTATFETRGLMSAAYHVMMRVGSHLDSKELLIAQ